jgi:hypothetical protein
VVVGNKARNRFRHHTSNYGMVIDVWEFGVDAKSINCTMTGTSQAAAITTGKLIKEVQARKFGLDSTLLDFYQIQRK